MSQRWSWTGMVLVAGGLFLFQSGCAGEKPKPAGNTTVDPAAMTKPGVPSSTVEPSAPSEKEAPSDEESTPKTPADAGSTTGGGIELPGAPGEEK